MSKYKINPYTGLPFYSETKFEVVSVDDYSDKYYVKDASGKRISKILTKRQLSIATQHTINAASSTSNGEISDVGKALINFAHKSKSSKNHYRL